VLSGFILPCGILNPVFSNSEAASVTYLAAPDLGFLVPPYSAFII
jgi:hypothetical protein